ESLGKSLHQVGYCLFQMKQYAEALNWAERAVKEAEQGDIHGRVDHQGLQRSREAVEECRRRLAEQAD
ncbi:hypothetical protein, partial [Pararhodospirillum oryzae]|uniref:hypothetical protein n=1 Tax=Pararhodospirillum oryzae TaxID=478448 RepID=UPI001478C5D0